VWISEYLFICVPYPIPPRPQSATFWICGGFELPWLCSFRSIIINTSSLPTKAKFRASGTIKAVCSSLEVATPLLAIKFKSFNPFSIVSECCRRTAVLSSTRRVVPLIYHQPWSRLMQSNILYPGRPLHHYQLHHPIQRHLELLQLLPPLHRLDCLPSFLYP